MTSSTPKTPDEARTLADWEYLRGHYQTKVVLRDLADQIEALTSELEGYKKDAERYAKKYQHYHLGINGRICAVCDFDVTDPIHISAAIAKGTAI